MKTAKPFFQRCAWFLDCEDRDHVLNALQVRGSQLGVNFPWGTCDKVWRLGGHHSLEGTLLVSTVSGARDVAKHHAMHRTDPPTTKCHAAPNVNRAWGWVSPSYY